jgi:hypothetical protein
MQIQHKISQHNNAEHCYAECQLCSVSFMLSFTGKLYMLRVIMLNVVMPTVIKLTVVAPVTSY